MIPIGYHKKKKKHNVPSRYMEFLIFLIAGALWLPKVVGSNFPSPLYSFAILHT